MTHIEKICKFLLQFCYNLCNERKLFFIRSTKVCTRRHDNFPSFNTNCFSFETTHRNKNILCKIYNMNFTSNTCKRVSLFYCIWASLEKFMYSICNCCFFKRNFRMIETMLWRIPHMNQALRWHRKNDEGVNIKLLYHILSPVSIFSYMFIKNPLHFLKFLLG